VRKIVLDTFDCRLRCVKSRQIPNGMKKTMRNSRAIRDIDQFKALDLKMKAISHPMIVRDYRNTHLSLTASPNNTSVKSIHDSENETQNTEVANFE
jgi:hypothetical protein